MGVWWCVAMVPAEPLSLSTVLASAPQTVIPALAFFVAHVGAPGCGPWRVARVTAHDASALAVLVSLWWDKAAWLSGGVGGVGDASASEPLPPPRVGFPPPWRAGDVVLATDLVVREFAGARSLSTTRSSASAVLARCGREAPAWRDAAGAAAAGAKPRRSTLESAVAVAHCLRVHTTWYLSRPSALNSVDPSHTTLPPLDSRAAAPRRCR